MRPRSILPAVLVALALLALAHAPALAVVWSDGDTLTVIWKPLPNLPALARPGDTVTVWANAPSGASGWGASIRVGALVRALAPAGGGYQSSRARWELGFRVPSGTPEEMYDLIVTSDSTLPDTTAHSVKVLPAFRTDFYFAQISDTHLPTHALSVNGQITTSDSSGMADFDAVIDDLNLIHPEFVLHTGDLVNEGELEEYLGMYEMGRSQLMLSRLRDPIFVVSGNHDIGGWGATLPPDGTSRKNWWRHFGWSFLGSPPAGDPYHSQDYHFDYGLLHVIGLEAYINSGSYDHYMTNIWGAQSMTAEQMIWLAADVAAVPAGHGKLAFFHYDFGGTMGNGLPAPNFTQFANPAALGLDGVIWGHNHGVAEGNRTARPFNLGLQAVIDGRRTFRIFRVSNGVITPGPMHHSGGSSTTPTDSMTVAWSAPNDGTRSRLTETATNRFGESWEHARIVFNMVNHDSSYAASGGTIAQTILQGGKAIVYVDCVLPAGGTAVVSVSPLAPTVGVEDESPGALRLHRPAPNPYRPGSQTLVLRFALAAPGPVRVAVYDLGGRRIATVFEGERAAGDQAVRWDGRGEGGERVAPGQYVVRLEGREGHRVQRLVVVR